MSASAVRGVSRAERGDRAASPRPSRSAPRSWRSTGHASKVLRRFTASPSRRDPQEWIPRTVQMMQSEAPMRRSAATQHVADKDQPREPWSCAVGVEARACFACQVAAERGRTVAGSCMAGKRSEGSASASCQQSASKSPSHRTTWHRVASAALPPELRRCSTANSAGQRRVGAALASHGRGHRFDPCHAHQPKRFPAPILRAVCQKICQKITAWRWSTLVSVARSEPLAGRPTVGSWCRRAAQVANLPDLALGAGGRFVQATIGVAAWLTLRAIQ